MRSLIAMLAIAGMFLAGPAFADDDDDDGPGNGPPCFITGTCGGGGGGGVGDITNRNTNDNSARATGGDATAFGGDGGDGFGLGVAGAGVFDSGNSSSTSGATALSGPSTAISGPSVADAYSGVDFEDATFGNSRNSNSISGSLSGSQDTSVDADNDVSTDVDIDASDRSTTIVEDRKDPVASAAPVFASACSAGVSAQSYGFGGALANTNPMCDLALAVELAIKVDNFELARELTDRAATFARHRTNPVRMYGQWIPFLGQLF